MRKGTNVLMVALLWVGCAAATSIAALEFIPPAEPIPEPYTNETCLKNCHGEPHFAGVDEQGRERDMQVEALTYVMSTHGQKGVWCIDCHQGADPNTHPRTGYPQVDCRACHAAEPPEGVFPEGALGTLKARNIEPPKPEAHKGDGWSKTRHGVLWAEGNPNAPFCNDCHTAHAIRKSDDPASTVHHDNLPETCGRCHEGQVAVMDEGGWLARFRLSGHGKGDLRNTYKVTECVSCHQGEAAHGEEAITEQKCATCHQPGGDKEVCQTTRFHIQPGADDQPVASAMRWLYRAGFWGGVIGVGLLVLFLGFSAVYRRDGEE